MVTSPYFKVAFQASRPFFIFVPIHVDCQNIEPILKVLLCCDPDLNMDCLYVHSFPSRISPEILFGQCEKTSFDSCCSKKKHKHDDDVTTKQIRAWLIGSDVTTKV